MAGDFPTRYIRPELLAFKPYSSARSLYTEGFFLDANENPYNLFSNEVPLNRYPDGSNKALREGLAELSGLTAEQTFVGNGSDEAIDLLIRVFCAPGEAILICTPTYGMYTVAARLQGAQVLDVPLEPESFRLRPTAVLEALQQHPHIKAVFLCSPNNPTGQVQPPELVEAILQGTDRPVIVDEAYVEFTLGPGYAPHLAQYPHLILLRTLSKAWALAGCRIGYCHAHPLLIGLLQTVKPPYNLNQLTTRTALAALRMRAEVERTLQFVLSERNLLAERLAALPGMLVYPSDANFLLVRVAGATALQAQLAQKKLIVRDRSNEPGLNDCLRISVGSPAENLLLAKTLGELLANR